MNTFDDIGKWFQAQCNGDWEHTHGITIRSTDNPGWWVTIDLRGTTLESKVFVPMGQGDHASTDPQPPWLFCHVQDAVFHGAGDVAKLDEILHNFLTWAQIG